MVAQFNRKNIAILIVFLVLSCTFELDEEYFNDSVTPVTEIQGISTTLRQFDLNEQIQGDTIAFWTEQDFIYNVATPNGEQVLLTEAFLDGESLTRTSSRNLSINIDPADYGTGFYTLTIAYLIRTGSGSLADISGLEALAYQQSFVLAIDISPPQELSVISTEIVNGFVTPSWEKYDRFNFQEYRVQKYCRDERDPSNGFSTCGLFIITDPDVTSYADSTFLEGAVRYSVNVRAANQESTGALGPIFETRISDPLTVTGLPNGDFQITWGKPTVENALDRYDLYLRNDFPAPIIFQSTNPNDTTFIYDSDDRPGPGFSRSTFALSIIPKVPGGGNPQEFQLIEARIGADTHPFGSFASSDVYNSIYTTSREKTATDGYLFKIDINSLEKTDSIKWSTLGVPANSFKKELFVSKDRQRLFLINSVNLFEINPNDLSLTNSFTLGNYDDTEFIPKVSSTGIMVYASGGQMRVFNVNTGNDVTLPNNFFGSDEDGDITEDGKYIYDNSYLFEYNGSQYVEKSRLATQIFHARFIDNTRILAYRRNAETFIYNLETDETQVLYEDNQFYMDKFGQYDPFTNTIYSLQGRLFNGPNQLSIMNLNDFTIRQTPVSFLFNNNAFIFQIANGRLFWQDGKYLDQF